MAQAERTDPTEDHAKRLTNFGFADFWNVAQRVVARTGTDRIGLVAAGVAFFALLALFPGITALVAVAGLILDPAEIVQPLETGTAALPPEASDILLGELRDVADEEGRISLNLAAIVALAISIFSASRGVANLMAGLNVAYEEEEKRGLIVLTLRTLALTLFLLVALSLLLAVFAILPAALAWAGDLPFYETVVSIARWPLLFLIGGLIFTTLYRFGPSRRAARWRWLAPGGLLACALWIGATAGFGWYVETLGSYAETFGALAGVIVLLLWLWLTVFAVLFGAVVDAELEHQTLRDSTIGPDRPMGHRGAVKADTFAGGG